MKFFHLSDLHIGRQLNGWSLKGNQERVLAQITEYVGVYRPDAILICGDVYDKSIPSGEAFSMFGHFLEQISETGIPALIIAGNHDSPERLGFAGPLLEKGRIFLSSFPPSKEGEHLKKVTLKDRWGNVNFYLFPFMRPGYVRPLLRAEGREYEDTYDGAFRAVLERETIDTSERNVILCHQFFTSSSGDPETCESETAVLTAGGLDAIGSSALDLFDYAALGHIHGPQKAGRETVRYCGSPYKYSVSEERHKKSVVMAELAEKGEPAILTFLPLSGVQDVRSVRGTLQEVLGKAEEPSCHDFVKITLTDDREPAHFREQLRERYDHILEIRIDNERTRESLKEEGEPMLVLSPMEAFRRFFTVVQKSEMTKEEEALMEQIIEEAKEEMK